MCVRDFNRRRCQSSKKAYKATKLRHFDCHKGLWKSASREPRSQYLGREAVDLFCPELLPMLDPQNCYAAATAAEAAEVSDLPMDDLLVQPTAIKTTAAELDVSSTSCAFNCCAKLPSEFQHFDQLKSRLWDDIDKKSQLLSLAHYAGDKSNTRSMADGANVWHGFRPDPGSKSELAIGAVQRRARRSETAEFYISLGNSRQSNFLPCERWPTQPRGAFESQHEGRGSSSELPPRRESNNARQTRGLSSLVGSSCIHAPGEYTCTFKFREAIGILLERETETCYQLSKAYVEKLTENSAQNFEHNELRATRRLIVKWMFEAVRLLDLSSLAAAHAVSILDRYLSQSFFRDPQDEANVHIRLAATACIWIAAKLEDSGAPNLSSIRGLSSFEYEEEKIREMEVSVLKCLGWRMLAATACDFLANMVAQLTAFGLPSHLLRHVGHRSEEIIQGLLSEAEFLAYQPSVVSISVMQCLLDEYVPVHTASIMAAFHLALAVDVETGTRSVGPGHHVQLWSCSWRSDTLCHRRLVDLVLDSELFCSLPSPDGIDCASLENSGNGCFHQRSSNLDVSCTLSRFPVSAI